LIKLHLGVIDVPEIEGTTYTVGQDLEKRYGLFSMFYNAHQQDIADLIVKDAAIGMEMIEKGMSVSVNSVFAVSGETITDKMHNFLTSQEIERVAGRYGEEGIPTKAALEGINTRTASGKAPKRVRKGQKFQKVVTGVRRPSFIDTGIFERSLKGWIE
jgi:hypothetical protein